MDARWNRVKIMKELMTSESNSDTNLSSKVKVISGVFKTYDYVVWLDADLVIIDWTFSIEELIIENPEKDIILSAEHHAETGVANTGSMIIRNSEWTLNFLQKWWDTFDHSINHDQIFFDRLYKSLSSTERASHIAILPTSRLNSIPPAMLYQQSDHKVLHMMGEALPLRRTVFLRAFRAVCYAIDSFRSIRYAYIYDNDQCSNHEYHQSHFERPKKTSTFSMGQRTQKTACHLVCVAV